MAMSKKDYEAIAEVIQEAVQKYEEVLPTVFIAEQIAVYCQVNNPRFDQSRFMEACGIKVGQNNG